MTGGNTIQDEVEATGMLLHLIGILRDDDFIRAQALAVGDLVLRSGEENHMSPESVGELHTHVTEAAQSHDAHFLAFANLPVMQRRVGGDAGAKQRSRSRGIKTLRYRQDEGLIDDDALGVAAVGDS